MAYPNANWGDIASTAMQSLQDTIEEQILNNNVLTADLNSKGKAQKWDGDQNIVIPLAYGTTGTVQWYTGYEPHSIKPANVFTAATFPIRQMIGTISISGLEKIQNSGPGKMFDLLDAKLENLIREMENDFETAIWGDGTGSSGKTLLGLQAMIPDSVALGTYGGISRVSYSWWRPQSYAGVADGGTAVGTANIRTYMMRLLNKMWHEKDKPTSIYADSNYYTYYWESLIPIQQAASKGVAAFEGIPVKNCSGLGSAAVANHMYFVNDNYVMLKTFKGRNFSELDTAKYMPRQDAEVRSIVYAGNLVCSNQRKQGVLIA